MVKDGMDIAICSLQGNTLKYAGANNPLWIVKDGEILETKANKQPIGKFSNPLPFTTHQIKLQKGDVIYIFSDGYADQFGGEFGKKLKYLRFRNLIIKSAKLPVSEQMVFLDDSFMKWRGDYEQIDDVCIMGIKV